MINKIHKVLNLVDFDAQFKCIDITSELKKERQEIEGSVLPLAVTCFDTALQRLKAKESWNTIENAFLIAQKLITDFEAHPYHGKVMTRQIETAYKLVKKYSKGNFGNS